MKESEGDRHKYAVCESSAIPISSERIHAYVEKNNDGQSLPRVGKVASEASRIGFWRYEKDRERSSQVRRLREHPGPLYPMGKAKRRRLRRRKRKPTPPRYARSPFQGKGLAWTLPPSYGRRCPEGAEVGWGESGMKKIGGDRLKYAICESAAVPDTKPSPRGEGAPKGRIGHWRYERQMRKTEKCAAHVWKA